MSLKGKSLAVLTPMYGGMCAANYFMSCMELRVGLLKLGIPHPVGMVMNVFNESLIPRARNRLVDRFLKDTDFTHAIFIDADIGFNAEDILALLEMDEDIVGATCSAKKIRWDRIQKVCRKNGRNRDYTDDELSRLGGNFVFNLEGRGTQGFDIRELKELKQLGTGLMMVRRNVFEKMVEAYPDEWYDSRGSDPGDLPGQVHDFFHVGINKDSRQYDSEDYWFCHDAKAIGFKVKMWPLMRTSHMGTYTFIGDMPAVAALAGSL
jgi:hypothetical protein